ncbi:hypothetical protein PsYK624_124480 [Phanerochaete sordida]|uniref:F-box domain-containing protein n=1 Tax=Phanerochaete sordida TaxID=48140 RepID=A0A9P3GL46_9APHY|nr:hypothetical protein PsYK624_124480 [Phanerochaete sordida]
MVDEALAIAPTLDTLPSEILDKILVFLPRDTVDKRGEPIDSLKACTFLSKSLSANATRILFRRLVLRTYFEDLVTILRKQSRSRKRLSRSVQELTLTSTRENIDENGNIHEFFPWAQNEEMRCRDLFKILKHLPNLTTLTLQCVKLSGYPCKAFVPNHRMLKESLQRLVIEQQYDPTDKDATDDLHILRCFAAIDTLVLRGSIAAGQQVPGMPLAQVTYLEFHEMAVTRVADIEEQALPHLVDMCSVRRITRLL